MGIVQFIDGCASLGVPLKKTFSTPDLHNEKKDQDKKKVFDTVKELAKVAGSKDDKEEKVRELLHQLTGDDSLKDGGDLLDKLKDGTVLARALDACKGPDTVKGVDPAPASPEKEIANLEKVDC